MGIDISKLEGTLKTLANLSDKDKNGKIEGEQEISIFKSWADTALENRDITDAEYKNIFGLESSASKPAETVKNASTNPMTRKERKLAKKEAEAREEHVLRKLNTVKPGISGTVCAPRNKPNNDLVVEFSFVMSFPLKIIFPESIVYCGFPIIVPTSVDFPEPF